MEFDRKGQRLLCRGRVAGRPERLQRLTRAGRAADDERGSPPRAIDGIDQQERPAGSVIAVQVSEVDGPQFLWLLAEPLQGLERRGAEVNRREPAIVLDQPASVAAPFRAEGVAAAEREDVHGGGLCKSGASSAARFFCRRWISRRCPASADIPPRSERSVCSASPPRRQRSRSMDSSFPA